MRSRRWLPIPVEPLTTLRPIRLLILQGFLCMMASTSPAANAAVSAHEQTILAAAQAENSAALERLEKLVNINSGTLNPAGVERVGRIMMEELQAIGFAVRWVPMTAVGRAGHVVAEHKGSGRGQRLLLIGHLDTVFEKDSPFQKFVRRGDQAEGPGANDMKDGLAIMVSALRALKNAGALRNADIRVVLSGDEEDPGRPIAVARADMIRAAEQSDVALEFEALAQENGRDMGSISRRSSSSWTIRSSAQSGHSSGVFSEDAGYGAIYELARILDAFQRHLREPNATFNAGLILGGAEALADAESTAGNAKGKTNIIAAVALATGDLRTLSNEQTERLRAKMRDIVSAHLPGTRAEITFEDSYPAMPPTEGNRALLRRLNDINRDLELPPMPELDPLKRGAGDIAFVADKVDGLIGFGAAGKGSHGPGETVDLTSFDRQIKRTALLISRLARTPR